MSDKFQPEKLGEPDAHKVMRRAKVGLRVLLLLAIVATIALLALYRPAAYLAALPVPVLFLAYIYVSYTERRARAETLRGANQHAISKDEIELDIRVAGFSTAFVLLFVLALSTFVVAATMIEDWANVGVGAAILVLLSILIIFPYIPLFILESENGERAKLRREVNSARSGK